MNRFPFLNHIAAAALIGNLLGCATDLTDVRKPESIPKAVERRAFVFNSPTCLATRDVTRQETIGGLLVAAIAPKLIGFVVDRAAGALQKAAAAKTETLSAANGSYFHLYDGDTKILGDCVILIYMDSSKDWSVFKSEIRKHWPDHKTTKDGSVVAESDRGPNDAQIDQVRSYMGFNDELSGGPAFYYEATVIPSADRTAFKLQPAFLYYPESLGTGKVGDVRALNLVYTYRGLDGSAVATSTLSLPDVRVGSVRGASENKHFQSPWLPALTLSDATKAIVSEEKSKTHIQTPRKLLTPFNLEASVSETRSAREWLKAIADVLGSDEVKTAANTALRQQLIPGEAAKAAASEELTSMTAEREFELAKLDHGVACVAFKAAAANSAELATSTRDVVEKQYIANEKAIKAGKAREYPTPETPLCK
jgi:hypothetical protein